MVASLYCSLILASQGPMPAPLRPVVDVEVVGNDRVLIRSIHRIESVRLAELTEWSSYFLCYSSDGRRAVVLIRTRQNPLKVTVETRSSPDMGVLERHEVAVKNPWAYSSED